MNDIKPPQNIINRGFLDLDNYPHVKTFILPQFKELIDNKIVIIQPKQILSVPAETDPLTLVTETQSHLYSKNYPHVQNMSPDEEKPTTIAELPPILNDTLDERDVQLDPVPTTIPLPQKLIPVIKVPVVKAPSIQVFHDKSSINYMIIFLICVNLFIIYTYSDNKKIPIIRSMYNTYKN